MPSGSVQGQTQIAVWDAQLKLLGMALPSNYTGVDGDATFSTDIDPSLLVGVAVHELTHALGRVPYGPQPDIFDLFRFTSPGSQLLLSGNTAPAAYFSVDGGNNKLADFGQTSDPSDFLNSGVQGPNDPFNEFYTSSTLQSLTPIDKEMLDALGFHLTTPVSTTVETFGSTGLFEVADEFFMYANGTTTGPSLKNDGVPLVAGSVGPWAPIAAEAIAGGYEVAWKAAGADQYLIWDTDSNGYETANPIGIVSGNSPALEALEPSFHQDLNGDGVIGIPATVIESFGSTTLTEEGGNYFLDNGATTGPSLKNDGVPLVAGSVGPWAPIGAEAIAGGYEVAWKAAGADQYLIWDTDSNGYETANPIGIVSGNSPALEALEPSFHQDLNGDGVIGIPGTIELFGSTSLVQTGNIYFLDSNSSGTGPSLKNDGVPLVAGSVGPWAPIAAEAITGGYEVAWKAAGADQ